MSDEALYEHAVKMLARRPRTNQELRRLLASRASPAAVDGAIARLVDRGYLNDRRLAESFALYQRDVERHGAARVFRELRRRGLSDDVAGAAVRSGFAGAREPELLRAYIRKKRQRRPESWPDAARLFRGWLRAGFSPAAARGCLRQWKLSPEWLEALENAESEVEDAEA